MRSRRCSPVAARSASTRAASSAAAAASIARASSFRHRAGMTRTITVAALQLPLPGPVRPNIDAVSALVEAAAAQGAQIILPPELFEGPYFCQVEEEALFATARAIAVHPRVAPLRAHAPKHHVRTPTSLLQ